jgi:hypothetical protein
VTNLFLVGPQNLLAYIDADTGDREFREIIGLLGGDSPRALVFDPGTGLLYFTSSGVHAYDYESSAAVIISQ